MNVIAAGCAAAPTDISNNTHVRMFITIEESCSFAALWDDAQPGQLEHKGMRGRRHPGRHLHFDVLSLDCPLE